VFNRPELFHLGVRAGAIFQDLHGMVKGTLADPARAWTRTRDLPRVAPDSFRDLWRQRRQTKP
jgi:hypothetical protein